MNGLNGKSSLCVAECSSGSAECRACTTEPITSFSEEGRLALGFTPNREKMQAAIDKIDLGPIKFKLLHGELKWPVEQIERMERLYRAFLLVLATHPDKPIVPTKAIDEFWHQHILDTRKYEQDCIAVFGHFVHHFPYLGMRGDADKASLEHSFAETCELFKVVAGIDLAAVDGSACTGCRGELCGTECSPDFNCNPERSEAVDRQVRPSWQDGLRLGARHLAAEAISLERKTPPCGGVR